MKDKSILISKTFDFLWNFFFCWFFLIYFGRLRKLMVILLLFRKLFFFFLLCCWYFFLNSLLTLCFDFFFSTNHHFLKIIYFDFFTFIWIFRYKNRSAFFVKTLSNFRDLTIFWTSETFIRIFMIDTFSIFLKALFILIPEAGSNMLFTVNDAFCQLVDTFEFFQSLEGKR